MKKAIFTSYFTLLFSALIFGQCPNGYFSSQEQIDNFPIDFPNCTEITNGILIEEAVPGDITNLNGLAQLTLIGGLNIDNSVNLVDLSGLESITEINGYCYIRENEALENLDALANVELIENNVIIGGNLALTNLDAFDALTEVPSLNITENSALLSIDGFNQLTTVESILITDHDELLSVQGFQNLEQIGAQLQIMSNILLETMSGFSSVTNVEGDIRIIFNPELIALEFNNLTSVAGLFQFASSPLISNLDALQSLTTVGENLRLLDLESLTSISGLSSLTSVHHIEILFIPLLESLNGLEGINTIPGKFFIRGSNEISDVTGLDNLTSAGEIEIYECSVADLSGLENLETINNGSLILQYNPYLIDITALSNLSSISGGLMLNHLTDLPNLNGLETLTSIGWLDFNEAFSLEDMTALSNVNYVNTTETISITSCQSINICNHQNLCDYIAFGGDIIIDNSFGTCNTLNEVLASCFSDIDHLVGQVLAAQDCTIDGDEDGLPNWKIHAHNDTYSFVVATDEDGNYWLPLLDGDWNISPISPVSYWESCVENYMISSFAIGDTITQDIPVMSNVDCPFIDWDMTMPPLSFCIERPFTFDYCNYGAVPANDVSFSVTIDPILEFIDASIPYTIQVDGSYLFEIGTVEVFDCASFYFTAMIECDTALIGETACIDVEVLPDDLCAPDSLWDGSTIAASGFYSNDSIFFLLQNIGTGDMNEARPFESNILIEDVVLLIDVDDYQLEAGGSKMLSYPIEMDAAGIHLQTNQALNHPSNEPVSLLIPNGGADQTEELFTVLPFNDGDPFMESFCRPVIASYDPNLKDVLPVGLGENHEIEKDWELNYTIQFQNTGNDTAYFVVIRDTLSEHLDLTTLQVGGASHPFTWNLKENRELSFHFDDILLVDSMTNEAASHGLLSFSITPKQDLIPGDLIENRVGIYFDYNAAVITNTVWHTITKPVIGTSEHLDWCEGEAYDEVELYADTTVQYTSSFIEYDSVHFVHLDVHPNSESSVMTEVIIGSYLNDVLITGDTVFISTLTNYYGCDSLVTYTVSTLSNVNGVNDFAQTEVFPNPTTDLIQVLHHENGEAQQWKLRNHLGQVIWQNNLNPNAILPGISLIEFPVGVYFLIGKSGNSSSTWRIIKQE